MKTYSFLISVLAIAALSCMPCANGMEQGTPHITKVINKSNDSVYILPTIFRLAMGFMSGQKFQPVKLEAWEIPADPSGRMVEHDVMIPIEPPTGLPLKYSSDWGLYVIAGTTITSFTADQLLKRGKNLVLTVGENRIASIKGTNK
jgi:hypothetical protein